VPGSDRDAFESQLLGLAEERLRHHGMRLNDDARSELEKALSSGARTLSDEPERDGEAAANLNQWIDELAKEPKFIHGLIDATALALTKMSLCPLFPFC
jgi:hypothetical protein